MGLGALGKVLGDYDVLLFLHQDNFLGLLIETENFLSEEVRPFVLKLQPTGATTPTHTHS